LAPFARIYGKQATAAVDDPMPAALTDSHQATDAALAARLACGEAAALDPLYRRHKVPVYRFALLWCGAAAVAADVTQDVFVHLLTQAGDFDPARGPLGPWLLGIARNFVRRRRDRRRIAGATRRCRARRPLHQLNPSNQEPAMDTRPRFPKSPLQSALLLLSAAAVATTVGAATPPPRAPSNVDTDMIVKEANEAAKEAAALAREQAGHAAELAQMYAQADLDDMMEPSFAYLSNEFGNAREIVKNAPYTAEAVNESIQVLPDGNRIVKRSSTLLARDGYGRTRQDKKGARGTSVYIFDPMEGKSYVLNTERKIAVRIPRVPSPPVPPVPPVPRIGRGDMPMTLAPMAPLPPLALPILPRGKGETKSLGTRDVDGIKADGTQTTHTIPAGEIGNEKPIVVTSERWFSPEFNIVVYAKQSDPRSGDTIYRLTNFKRGEPSAELFKLPADYKARGESRR
jgi:DNA-directed RNA polymerase specialized sigma24 family protein